tara:strand:+ start:325 stop:483 length:159 start_codon:yes stop_codon:yes gene_type:complete
MYDLQLGHPIRNGNEQPNKRPFNKEREALKVNAIQYAEPASEAEGKGRGRRR